jgi:hypothetical protein
LTIEADMGRAFHFSVTAREVVEITEYLLDKRAFD